MAGVAFQIDAENTWALFCAACISGVWLALTSPRQFTPMRNPSGASLPARIQQGALHNAS